MFDANYSTEVNLVTSSMKSEKYPFSVVDVLTSGLFSEKVCFAVLLGDIELLVVAIRRTETEGYVGLCCGLVHKGIKVNV